MRPLVVQVVLADDEDEDWDEADDHLKQQRELTSDIDAAVGGGHSGGTRRDSVGKLITLLIFNILTLSNSLTQFPVEACPPKVPKVLEKLA